ncbi:hypothetical protein FRC06_010563 [Ceratobasidium sp. 370]|nr:hypothetical protein FRC06_010563 [Ceratobasidium sp. 370]
MVMAATLVDTSINYLVPPADGSKPYSWITANHPGGGPMRNWESASYQVTVENIRGRESSGEFTLDKSGFEFHKIPSTGTDFENDESIRSTYYEDCIRNIKNLTGASRVVIFDHTLRKPWPAGTPETPETRSPVNQPTLFHQTPDSAVRRVHLHLPAADVPALLSKRFQIINLWRPIQNPAWQFPLALCDFRTVANRPGGDFVAATLKYPDRDGETLAVKHNDAHKWKYLAGMTPDELVLIKCFDSKDDGNTATFTPHTAIEDPTTPADAPDRQSIEIRALVFYD